jgi:hypothetical protein
MSFFSFLFKSAELKSALAAAEEVRGTFEINVFREECRDLVAERVDKRLKANEASVRNAILVNGMKPIHLAFNAFRMVAAEYAVSPPFPMIEGILTDRPDGFLAIFTQATKRLVEDGIIPEEQGRKELAHIRQGMMSMGYTPGHHTL